MGQAQWAHGSFKHRSFSKPGTGGIWALRAAVLLCATQGQGVSMKTTTFIRNKATMFGGAFTVR